MHIPSGWDTLNVPRVLVICFLCIKCLIRGSLNTFPDFFRMGIFIDSTHMKL